MSEGPTPPPPRGFPASEFAQRLARARRRMAEADLDLLLLTGEADIRWFSGFHTPFWQSPTRPWFLLVPASGAPVAVIPGIGEACMRRTWVRDVRTWSSPDPVDDGVSLVADTVRELAGAARARIGLPMGAGTHLRLPLADFERLRAALPDCRWVDASAVVHALRAVKSAAEIRKIRHACDVASRAFGAVPELYRPGIDDVELFRAFKVRCLQEGADDVAYLVGAAGPGGYGDIISPPAGRTLARGDVLILDTGCTYDGHYCDFDRNWSVGEPATVVAHAYRVAWEATEAGLAAVRPGVRCDELHAAMERIMAPHAVVAGNGGVGRLGHGLGTQLTEPPSLMPGDRTEMVEGMVITLEPGFEFASGRQMVHEENVLVTVAGHELLSRRAPADIPVIGED